MPGVAGKKARVKISTTAGGAGVYNNVAGVKSFSHSIDGSTVDDSEMGVEYVQNIAGLVGGKLTINGTRRLTDTNGQVALIAACLAGTTVWYHALPDGGTTANVGFKQEAYVTKAGTDSDVAGANSITFELTGTGPITLI